MSHKDRDCDRRWTFHDMRLPAMIMYKIIEGTVNASDIPLICIISNCTKHLPDGTGKGCNAGNGYLATSCNIHPKYASERIHHLREQGLLLVINHNGTRYLEMEWDRTAEERAELDGEYGELYRQEYANLQKRLADRINHVNGVHKDSSYKRRNTPPTKDGTPLLQKTEQKTKEYKEGVLREHTVRASGGGVGKTEVQCESTEHMLSNPKRPGKDAPLCAEQPPVISFQSESKGKGNGKKEKTSKGKYKRSKLDRTGLVLTSFGMSTAKLVGDGLRSGGYMYRYPNMEEWGYEFEALAKRLTDDGGMGRIEAEQHITRVLTHHVTNIRYRYQPKLVEAQTICQQFYRLEDALSASQDDSRKETELYTPSTKWRQEHSDFVRSWFVYLLQGKRIVEMPSDREMVRLANLLADKELSLGGIAKVKRVFEWYSVNVGRRFDGYNGRIISADRYDDFKDFIRNFQQIARTWKEQREVYS